MTEAWKPVVGYEGAYEVSSHGRIKKVGAQRKDGSAFIMKPYLKDRYVVIELVKNGQRKRWPVHRLVLIAFFGYDKERPHVNHIDGNRGNNMLANLEWVTIQENMKHAIKTGLFSIGANHQHAKLNEENVVQIRRMGGTHTFTQLANHFGVSEATLVSAMYGRTWKHVTEPIPPRRGQVVGERSPRTPLTGEEVLEIREQFATGLYPMRTLGKMHNTSGETISKIVRRASWRHI